MGQTFTSARDQEIRPRKGADAFRDRDQNSVGALKEVDVRISAQVDSHSINPGTQNIHPHRSELPPLQMYSVKHLRPQEKGCQPKTQDRGTVKEKEREER